MYRCYVPIGIEVLIKILESDKKTENSCNLYEGKYNRI